MTVEEFNTYQEITIKLFNYMNGRINTLNRFCTLTVDMYDLVNRTYGNIRYPNHITIFLGTAIDSWDPQWSCIMSKHDYICTSIAWAISHELHHADQLISMINYGINPSYKSIVEGDVERASYNWVSTHSGELSRIANFNCVIDNVCVKSLPDTTNYKKASVKEFYLQTLANIVIRDLDVFRDIEIFSNDDKCENIIIDFNSTDYVTIKSGGNYLQENINIFNDIVYKYAGYWDTYSIDINIFEMTDKSSTFIVKIDIKNQIINPITF